MKKSDNGELFDEVAPDPSSMIESMRSAGYTLQTAVADLIDNSIAALAKTVLIDFSWEGPGSWVRIVDDGKGMTEETLRNAMRLGSHHPNDPRDKRDLGRFGLGLKTASLSQCRRLTVTSRGKGGRRNTRAWDLDHLAREDVKGWQLLKAPSPGSESRIELRHSTGTVVLWEELDRLVGPPACDEELTKKYFLRQIANVEKHLSMVFHRYLSTPRPKLKILLNGNRVPAWDPFIEDHPATQAYPVDPISIPHAGSVSVKEFVLPHKDKLGEEAHSLASGPAGWNAQQGFYVYRNKRLILPGNWLGLGKGRPWTKEEHYKLARIRIDLPNSMDHLWQLDVKKSTASPPAFLADRLYALAADVRRKAREVFAHRGRYGKRRKKEEYARPWKSVRRGGSTAYRVDRKHPLIRSVIKSADQQLRKEIEAMLAIVEETVPVQQIWLDAAEHPEAPAAPFESTNDVELRRTVRLVYAALRRNNRWSHAETVSRVLLFEEFADERVPAILETLTEEE